MSAERLSRVQSTLLRGTVLLFCLLLGVALMGATVTTSGSGGGVTCSGCSANVIPVSDGSNLINSGLTYHAGAGLFPTVDNTLDLGALSGSRLRHAHLAGTLHATTVTLDTLTARSGTILASSVMRILRLGLGVDPDATQVLRTAAGAYWWTNGVSLIGTGIINTNDIFLRPGNINGSWAVYDSGLLAYTNTTSFGWPSATAGATPDTTACRNAAAVVGVGGSACGTTGSLIATHGHFLGSMHAVESMVLGAHVVTIANNGVASVENAEILTGARSLYFVDCLDANGCTLHVGNSGLTVGQTVRIVSISANASLLIPSVTTGANLQHVAGATFSMGVNDVLSLQMIRNRSGASYLVETGRSNN